MFARKFFWMPPLLFLICAGCTSQKLLTQQQAMHAKMSRYAPSANRYFTVEFHRAGVTYPPKQLALLIFKKSRRLQLYARNQGSWHFIKTYPILAASGGPGPKLRAGDHQVPDGIYQIIGLNPSSHFDLSMHLDYPNAFDRHEAKLGHRQHLGGDIFIHGKDRSVGCVAIGDAGIQQLFPLVAEVGVSHVRVIIAPDDLRRRPPIYGREHPTWLPSLYHRISMALRFFPEPNRV